MGRCLGLLVFSAERYKHSVSNRHLIYRKKKTFAKTTMITSASSDVGHLQKSLKKKKKKKKMKMQHR